MTFARASRTDIGRFFIDRTTRIQNPQGWGYAVFGKVTAGQNVVDEIARVPTSTHGFYGDVPVDDIVIEKAEIL